MNYSKIDIEITGQNQEKWGEIKNNIISIHFPEIVPGPGDKFENLDNLILNFKETDDDKIYDYMSEWISEITPTKDQKTVSNKNKKLGQFIVIEDSIGVIVMRFYNDQNEEILSHSFRNVYPIKIETNTMNPLGGSIERSITFHAEIDQKSKE